MKKLIVIIGFLISFAGYSQILDISNGENGLSVRNKINTAFSLLNNSVVNLSDSITVFVTPTQLGNISEMVYPSAGIAVSTGMAWGTSISDNSTNWNTAYGWGDWSSGMPSALMTFSNKSGNISQWTNDSGYLTGNETITLSGGVTGSGTTTITTTIATGAVGANELANTTVTEGSYTNANITVDADGRLTDASSGSSGAANMYNEIPTGTINGTNTSFTLSNTPVGGTARIYLNGLRQTITTDYSVTTNTVTFTVAPISGDVIIVDYNY